MNDPLPRRVVVGEMPYEVTRRLRVFVDDVEQEYVVSADVDAGIVVVLDTDADGEFILNGAGDAVVMVSRMGAVRLEWKD